MFFLFEVCFLFWFCRPLLFMPVHVLKRKGRLKPATTAQFFFDRLRPRCENPSVVLECATSSSLYDDALFHATRGHPTTRRLERRRRGSAGEAVPASATRIAPARAPLHEPG